MTPDDPRHGTYAGAAAHWKDQERACDSCVRAASRKRKWNLYLKLSGNPATLPSTGTVRRIRALQAIGWTHAEIAAAAGLSVDAIRSPVHRGTSVYRATADGIERAYDALCMKVAPDSRNARYCRTAAARRGWAPPLAWDNIDDPDERPVRPEKVDGRKTVHRIIEDAEWLADSDLSLSAVCERLDINRDTFRDILRREGRSDLYWRLANREPDADLRRSVRDGIRRSKEVA